MLFFRQIEELAQLDRTFVLRSMVGRKIHWVSEATLTMMEPHLLSIGWSKSGGSRRGMRTFFFIRHGQTEWNRLEKKQGHVDIPMNETGHQQAREIQPLVSTLGIEVVVSSDLIRAIETTKAAFPGQKFITDKRLREVHIEEAESEAAALKRLDESLNHWFQKFPQKRVCFVTHGMLMRLFSQRCLSTGFRQDLRAPNCSIYQFFQGNAGYRLHQIFHP